MKNVLGHPSGLFILFFTEMWERFSYYGMRALLVLFLVSAAGLGGWEWSNENALQLYATYTGLVYVTPIFGGMIADKFLGYRNAVTLGALLMTLGHASMAFETEATFYLGLALLIIGNGFFKPNISSIVGQLYKSNESKKDAGYTIFYMGINAGAFLGIFLCGYIGEKVGWSYGFGLAGIFMFFGMLQFWFSQKIFGEIGLKPQKKKADVVSVHEDMQKDTEANEEIANYSEEQTMQEINSAFPEMEEQKKKGLVAEIKNRLVAKIASDRLVVIGVLAFFTIFFWMAFEQAGGSMTIFAKDFTDRVLEGSSASMFTLVNALLAIVPLAIITWVLILLFRATFKKYALANIFLGASFVIIWGIVIWMVNKEMNMHAYEVQFSHEVTESYQDTLIMPKAISEEEFKVYLSEKVELKDPNGIKSLSIVDEKGAKYSKDSTKYIVKLDYFMTKVDTASVREDVALAVGDEMYIVDVDGKGKYRYLNEELQKEVDSKIKATVITEKENEVEVPASWFGVLNSLFIILFAPLFSKIWESRYNPSAPIKFAIGLILLGLGFGVLAFGASGIDSDNPVAVSMVWLILAYLLHTLGELALSPVGLSYVSKLSPPKLVGLMFGIWFTATAIANWLAGMTGSMIDKISEEYSLAAFFLIFTFLPIITGLILVALNKWLLKKMHGIK